MNAPFPTLRWSEGRYHPAVVLPTGYEVYDFTEGYDPGRVLAVPWGVGRYDERRRGMYNTELFREGARDLHVGVDLGGPVGVAVHAFDDGEIHALGYNPAAGDYGHVIVTAHAVEGATLWALHGHLGARSLEGRRVGDALRRGEVLGWIGDRHENGGWNPHLHFQLSWERPETHDLPGVVRFDERDAALRRFPDPRGVLGPLYPDAASRRA